MKKIKISTVVSGKMYLKIFKMSNNITWAKYNMRSLVDKIHFDHIKQAYFAFFGSVYRYGLLLYGSGSSVKDILLL